LLLWAHYESRFVFLPASELMFFDSALVKIR
jgi:hypothetical protein